MDKKDIKILIVNDKIDLRNIIRDYLRQDGYSNLTVSENGKSAFRKAKSEKIDMIVADYDIPELSGLDLLKAIRNDNLTSELPFILISSETQQKHVALAAEKKVDAYIVKPFSYQTLSDKVDYLLRKILKPSDSDIHYRDANRLAGSGLLEEALDKYRQAMEASQNAMAAIHYKVGRIHEQMQMIDTAESDYHEAIAMSDVFVEAHDALGEICLQKGDSADALGYFKRSSEISPLNASRQMNLGEARYSTGDFEGAEKAFKLALELDPTKTHLFNHLGISMRRQGKLGEALEYLIRAAEIASDDENLFYNISRVYMDLGDAEEAKKYLNKALGLNPHMEEARVLLDRIREKA